MNRITKTIIIPNGCVERIVDFSDLSAEPECSANEIFMAAVARHVRGYQVDYPSPKRHNLVFCVKGGYLFEYEGETAELKPGELFLFPAGERQKFWVETDSENVFFLLEPETFGAVEFLHRRSENAELIRLLLEKALRGQSGRDSISRQIRCELFLLLLSLIREEIHVLGEHRFPERLKSLLRRNPERNWTVEKMAEACGLSASHLFSLCRKQRHVSPYGLLTLVRMELAETLLTRTDYPVKVIAAQCGYQQPFSFSRAFSKEHAGYSPEAWRKNASLKNG